MSEAAPIDRDEAMLAELAELALTAARAAHARLMAAEEAAEFHDAGRSFQRMGRALRQTLALKSKLKRDALVQAGEARAVADQDRTRQVAALKARVRAAVEPEVWNEHERDDWSELDLAELDDRLDAQAEAPDFLDTPVETHIARLRADLGLPPPDDAPTPEPAPEPAPESSA
jgi:hypothetical protein